MKGYGKRLLVCGLCLVFALVSLGATSQSMTLRTTVPGQVRLELRLTGRGSVRIGVDVFRTSATVRLPYSSVLEIWVQPESGAAVQQILWNGTEVMDALQDGKLTLTDLGTENKLCVTFRTPRAPGENPKTGDFAVLPAVLLNLSAAGGLALLYCTRKKTRCKPPREQ